MQRLRLGYLQSLAMCLPLALCLTATSCEDYYRVIVRISTTVHPQGGITRHLAVDAASTVSSAPKPESLSTKVGIAVARPEAWHYIDESPGRLRAEGYFASVESLPPTLSFDVYGTAITDRDRSTLVIEERTVVRRWVYQEIHGDLFSAIEVQNAVDVYVQVIGELLRSELPRHIGDAVDLTHVEGFVKGELRDFIAALVKAARQERARYPADRSHTPASEVFVRFGLPAPIVEEDDEFFDVAFPIAEHWFLSRLAEALARSEIQLAPEQLRFWPPLDEQGLEHQDTGLWDDWWADTTERVWGSEELIAERVGPAAEALGGYFEAEGRRNFRFEYRVRLPGVVLTTNGTLDGDEVTWLLRDADVTEDRVLSVESVELLDEGLKSLGARRSFDMGQLLRLHDLLFKRDPTGELGVLLTEAAAAGDFNLLRDQEQVPTGFGTRSSELADLLDPVVSPNEP